MLMLAAVLMLVGFSSSSSYATTTYIPPAFKTSGWWDTARGSGDTWNWVYPDFPIACAQNAPDARRFKALWLYPEDQVSQLNRTMVRKAIAAATSGIAASAERVVGNQSDLENSRAPRWATTLNCEPQITEVSVPLTVWKSIGQDPYPLWNWLSSNGYNPDTQNIKYVSFLQNKANPQWGGIADVAVTESDPTLNNAANFGSHLTILGSTTNWQNMTMYLEHEMAHALGAVSGEAPHYNSQNPYHPSDCMDILCYGKYYGEYYVSSCGSSSPWTEAENKFSWRLDCQDDDYYSWADRPWTFLRWAASNSSYLWGNPQPAPGAVANRGQAIDQSHHGDPLSNNVLP